MRTFAATALLLTAVLAGCGSGTDGTEPSTTAPTSESGTTTVRVAGMRFTPETVTIRVGETVTWEFDDNGLPHNVTADTSAPSEFRSPIRTTGSFTETFTEPGTYPYLCTLHPNMTGTVFVTE
ncbi:plastocyanin/azurin family copper-binding protein [Rhodococcus sp. NPDC003318]|uniref:cupredoxin domain-containing protein n=1 Tax=Rhodococcus sp. NPDC003318 TaxID=3364503 RepID=UPI0036C1A38B